jgi:hypothetical protein
MLVFPIFTFPVAAAAPPVLAALFPAESIELIAPTIA